MSALDRLSQSTRRWFDATFPARTPAQEQGWAAISGGRGVTALRPYDGTWEDIAVNALAGSVSSDRAKRLSLERLPDEARPALTAAGFVPTPRGLVLYG